MNNTTFDPGKPVQTRSGLKVVIYCTDAPGDYPIHGRLQREGEVWNVFSWTLKGTAYQADFCTSAFDLINTPEVVEGWVNVYLDANQMAYTTCAWRTKEACNISANPNRIACIPIKFTIGEGL